MSKDYTIVAVSAKQKHWESQYGRFITYYLKLEGEGEDAIEINKKEDSEPPKEGDVIHGDITDTQYGRKFKAAKKQFGGGGGGSYSKSPEDKEDIARAVALKAAVDFLSGKAEDTQDVLTAADTFLVWLKNEKPATEPENKSDEVYFPEEGEEVSLDDKSIPF